MSLKDKFKNSSEKYTLEKLEKLEGQAFESFDYLDSLEVDRERFIPPVDYTNFQNFVRYGLAEEYVETSFENIRLNYPYDGSRKEKENWLNSANAYNLHVFNKKYPRTNGYIIVSSAGWGSNTGDFDTNYGISDNLEYVFVKGGPHFNNLYATASSRASNLALDLSTKGFTTELWLKKSGSLASGLTRNEVLVEYWNNETGSATKGLVTLELYEYYDPAVAPFRLRLISGSTSENILLGDTTLKSTLYEGNWKHIAVSYKSQTASLYIDGAVYQTTASSNSYGDIKGNINANIGGLISGSAGAGKLSGSLDEFRHWKTLRTDEEIGRNWYTQVYGGTNSDTANTDLGVYFKFNGGITGRAVTDANILDYSGRLSNGSYINYVSTARNTGSAIVDSTAADTEFLDPILYSYHPDYVSSLESLVKFAKRYDEINQASLYKMFPSFILDEDDTAGYELKKLVQIMASYFDSLQSQIDYFNHSKDVDYKGPFKNSDVEQLPFVRNLIMEKGIYIQDLFLNSNLLEELSNKTKEDNYEFSKSLFDVKNLIYQNLYNNLSYILKSKGTEKSIRNVLRTFGVDEDLISITQYADRAKFNINNTREPKNNKRKFLRFNLKDGNEAVVYNFSTASARQAYIPAYPQNSSGSFTVEAEVIFPAQIETRDLNDIYQFSILTGSIFGVQDAISDVSYGTTSPGTNNADLRVLFQRDNLSESKSARFVLTSSNASIPTLTSSLFFNVYDESHWNFAVRVRPDSLTAQFLQKTGSIDYEISFYGVNNHGDQIINEFEVTGALTLETGDNLLQQPRRVYAGALNTNITGANIYKSDIKLGNVRAWSSYITNNELQAHAVDSNNLGTSTNYLDIYDLDENFYNLNLNKNNSLIFNWNFDFSKLVDFSSGSVSGSGYPMSLIGGLYPPSGSNFVSSLTASLKNEFLVDYRVEAPDKISKENDITFNKREIEEERFSRDQQFIEYNFLVEKSPYAAISREMLKYFEAVKDFNNFIGDPVNRYRDNYKFLRKQRELFFKRISNQLDVERFINFYKWIDHGLSSIIYQLIPESSNFNPDVLNVIESHVLERPKYKNKFPTLEFKKVEPEDGLESINRQLYNWKFNHAPIPFSQSINCPWWNERADRTDSVISSGDANVDSNRNQILSASISALNRSFSTPYRFKVDDLSEGKSQRKSSYWRSALQEFGSIVDVDGPGPLTASVSRDYLLTLGSDIESEEDCTDVLRPNKKVKKRFKISNSRESQEDYSYGKGALLAPFTLWSSSIDTGYAKAFQTNFVSNIEINNIHDDLYYEYKNNPLQGPFTDAHVGGNAYRHIALNTGTDQQSNRPEGFFILPSNTLGTASIGVVDATYTSDGTHDKDTPRARFYRDQISKRPLNIKNIQYSTASSVLGNFTKNYEVVMTNGRTTNNLWFKENTGSILTQTEIWKFNRGISSPYLNATLPTRTSNQTIIVNLFAAPGGPEITSRGYLEPAAEELSPYNALPFRNTSVLLSSGSGNNNFTGSGPRVNMSTNIHTQNDGLRVLLSRHSGLYGIDSVFGSVSALNYNATASYQQTNRNALSHSTGIIYDNFFVSHQIPRSDANYAWITASMSGVFADPGLKTCRYTIPSGTTSTSFPTASLLTLWERTSNQDFYLLSDASQRGTICEYNSIFNLVQDVNFDTFPAGATAANQMYNLYFLNGPYGYPTFKQITDNRNHFVKRQIENNIINSVADDRPETNYSFNEPPVLKKFKPFEHAISVRLDERDARIVDNKYSYLNNKFFYGNKQLNSLLNKDKEIFGNYDLIKKNYLSANRIGNVSFVSLSSEETIYPKAENTFLKEFRGRTNFTIDWWNSSRTSRTQNDFVGSYGITFPTASIWALDSEVSSSDGPVYPLTASGANTVVDVFGTGELQNPRTLFFKTNIAGSESDILVSPLYARPILSGGVGVAVQNTTNKYVVGVTRWDAGSQAGKNPFYYSDYDAYQEKIRLAGQDHTIIPEFKISDHVDQYLAAGENPFIELNNYFSILGGETNLSSSDNPNFLKEYSNSDFLQYFDMLRNDHSGIEGADPNQITLSCKSIMKFLPYEGFYPEQRTAQISTIFSQSYGSALSSPGTGSFRVLQTPLFSPGILFNSIKSGISLPYPVLTASSGPPTTAETYLGVQNSNDSPLYFIDGDTPLFADYYKFLPFESILEPSSYFNVRSGDTIYDSESLLEASSSNSAAFNGTFTKNYENAINNFLAESLNIFIDSNKSGVLISNPENRIDAFEIGKTYIMDLNIDIGYENYSRTSSYGPWVWDSTATTASPNNNMYVPFYRRSENAVNKTIKTIRLSYKATSVSPSMDEIISGLTSSHIDSLGQVAQSGPKIKDKFPQFTDCFNIAKVASTKLDVSLGNLGETSKNPIDLTMPIGDPKYSLVIQPKWQAPILDFTARSATVPAGADSSLYSVGMWHQYGALPGALGTVNISVSPFFSTTTGSLADVLGMRNQRLEIGQLKESFEAKEAIIAIPFVKTVTSDNRKFFEIQPPVINDARKQINGEALDPDRPYKAGASVVDMVSKMNNYVLPPKFDFLTYKEVTPVAMYIFEFNHTFSKQDLSDIWQNLPPSSTELDSDITRGFKIQNSEITHDINNGTDNSVANIGFEFPMFSIDDKESGVRWFVFKVKQRAHNNYFDKLASIPQENEELVARYPLMEKISYPDAETSGPTPVSYNWPYDYFSMVELVKLDTKLTLGKRFGAMGKIDISVPTTLERSAFDLLDSTNNEDQPLGLTPQKLKGLTDIDQNKTIGTSRGNLNKVKGNIKKLE